jgi:hypothetical protein
MDLFSVSGCGCFGTKKFVQYVANRRLLAIQFPQITLPQQSNRRSRAFGFSLFSSYCSNMFLRSVAHVQQLSSMVVKAWLGEPRGVFGMGGPWSRAYGEGKCTLNVFLFGCLQRPID